MEVVEDSLGVALDEFLRRPLFCFFSQQSDKGPRLSPLWFLWEDDAIWNVAQLSGRSYPQRVERFPQTAIAIVDFEPTTGRVEHVGMRGAAALEPYDEIRAERLFQKYLGEDESGWPDQFSDLNTENYQLIKFEPETIVARDQSYPAPTTGVN